MKLDALLCDHAQVSGGKLFISGANIDRIHVGADAQPPYLISYAVAGLIHVPWMATNAEHRLTLSLLTEDGRIPAMGGGPEQGVVPRGLTGEMRFNVGRPPQLAGGEEQLVPFAFNFVGLPLGELGRFAMVLSLDDEETRRLPFTLLLH
ncbi:MAG TPA: hypothetical protein VMT88_08115 [Actinomycetes bacterium]|nr:hypothetical protein [Actinomycetes bacterium]